LPRAGGALQCLQRPVKVLEKPERIPKKVRWEPAVAKVPKLVAYYRVSTKAQGESGLGLEGQRTAVQGHAVGSGGKIVAEFTEVESGKRADRPELAKALAHARHARGTLVIAKLDRLSRNVAFLANLMESHVDFVACDNPHASKFTIHILAAVAEHEAEQISARTKAALAAYRTGQRISKRIKLLYPNGVPPEVAVATAGKLGAELPQCRNLTPEGRRLGSVAGAAAGAALAAERVAGLGPEAKELRAAGRSLRSIAGELNERGYVTRRGLPWTPTAVLRLLVRAG
jgi:DNA invertase Pin-like site-specific DNA recombinase